MFVDLNDFHYFAEVVAHGGFAAAGRALGEPKSKLSRRVSQLEEKLGVRLIERSTRRFRVTEVGQAFYERCRSMMIEAESAQAVVAETRGEARGLVRFSCPSGLIGLVGGMVPAFLSEHPKIRLQIVVTNRAVDLIDDKIDVALRVRGSLDGDASLTMRGLAKSQRILVASPAVAARLGEGADIGSLVTLPTLSTTETAGETVWTFTGATGETRSIRHEPRVACSEFSVLRDAALAGLGVALIPNHACQRELQDGRLVRLFPEWHERDGIVHVVFTTKRGLPPAVRAFIDFLARRFRADELLYQQDQKLTG